MVVCFMPEQFEDPDDLLYFSPDADENYSIDLTTTEGYERHQLELGDWLYWTNYCGYPGTTFLNETGFLDEALKRYGFTPNEEGRFTQWYKHGLDEKMPQNTLSAFQRVHILAVAASPVLSTYQKADLLSMSAQALKDGMVPADGGRVVLRTLKGLRKSIDKYAKKQGFYGEARHVAVIEHYDTLAALVGESVPELTRREWFKHAASAVTGQRVTNIFKAIGIMTYVADNPPPVKIEGAEGFDYEEFYEELDDENNRGDFFNY